MEGISSILKAEAQDILIHIEYMDTKRIHDERHFQNLYDLYKHKFSGSKFDIIITSDDNAFKYILKYRNKLFPGTPAVFCGVNDFKDSMLIGHEQITGVVEDFDLKGTISVALKLHPQIKEIFVISGRTKTGMINVEKLKKVIPDFEDSVRFTFFTDLEAEELREKVQILPDDSIVLFLSFYIDKSGKVFSLKDIMTLVTDNSNVPVYTCWDTRLEYGAFGGMMVSGYHQGKTAAEMALRILNGEKVEDIPVMKESPNKYMFDYKQIKRFGIKLTELPVNSIIINKPSPFYTIHKNLIWTVLIGLLFLSLGIFIFLIIRSKRKRAEEALKLTQFSVERAADAVFWMGEDAKFIYVNETACRKLGYSRKELLSMTVHDIDPDFPKEVWQKHWEDVRRRGSFIMESHHKKRDGTIFPVEIVVNYINFDGKEFNCAFARDISERKQTDEILKESEERYRSVYDTAPLAFVIWDRDCRITDWNENAEKIFGWSKEKVLGRNFFDFLIPKLTRPHVEDVVDALLKGELPSHNVNENLTKSGKIILCEWNNSIRYNANGEVSGGISLALDITERKKSEEEIEKKQHS